MITNIMQRWGNGTHDILALKEMIKYGVSHVRNGSYDMILFHLCGTEELDLRRIMSEEYPDVPFITTNLVSVN